MPARSYGNAADARFVQRARVKLNMYQQEFGELVGMTQSAISLIENEESPLPYLARKAITAAVARLRALSLLEEGATTNDLQCSGSNLPPDRYLLHLPGCGPCLARAALKRDP